MEPFLGIDAALGGAPTGEALAIMRVALLRFTVVAWCVAEVRPLQTRLHIFERAAPVRGGSWRGAGGNGRARLPPLSSSLKDANDALPELKAPVEGKQVRMFGAKLDAGLAGTRAVSRATIQSVLRAYSDGNSTAGLASDEDQAEIFYGAAVDAMNRGDYDRSVKLLNRACYFAGVTSRMGGQMQLWLGQALYAAGRRGESQKLLTGLKSHPDSDVRKVGKELLFILQAPELVLDETNRVAIDMDNFNDDTVYERAPDGTIRKRSRVSKLEEQPEYGSVDWVLAQPVPPPVEEIDPAPLVIAIALCLAGLAFFAQQ